MIIPYNNSLNTTTANIEYALKRATEIGPTIAKGFSHLSSVAMSISMLSNAFDTLTDSEASWGQKLTTTTMALSMSFGAFINVIKGVNSALTALNSAQAISTAISSSKLVVTEALTTAEAESTLAELALIASTGNLTKAQIAQILVENLGMDAKKADTLAQILLTGATEAGTEALAGHTDKEILDTVATNAGTVANLKYAASQLLKNKYMLIAVAVLAILAAGIVAVVKAEKERIETNKKSAETSQEAAKAAKEEADANNELISSYKEALKAQDGTEESKKALEKAALDVANAYGIEGAAILALSGKYDQLTKKIIEARKAELAKQQASNSNAITATGATLADSLRKGDGRKTSDGGYTGKFGPGWSTGDEKAAIRAIDNNDYTYIKDNGYGDSHFDVSDITDTAEMYAYYQELEKFIADQKAEAAKDSSLNLGTSEVYQAALDELAQGKEDYAKLKELYQQENDILLELASYEVKTNNGKNIYDIETLSEYEEFKEKYLNQLATEKGIVDKNSSAYKELSKEVDIYLGNQEEIIHEILMDFDN